MFDIVYAYVEKQNMIRPGDCVVAGVSGGADSVCLFLVLCKLMKKIPFSLKVVHVNHGIRPDAKADEDYVRALCEKENIPFTCVCEDVAALAQKEGISEEEAGRSVRYKAFFDAFQNCEDALAKKRAVIAVAHHKSDRAETMLFHLFRGTGIKGLCSISPCVEREDGTRLVRPLLCVERKQIEEFLKKEQVTYCTDSTNLEDEYARNRIRHHILPYAEEEICDKSVEHMNRTMDLLSLAEDYLEEQASLAKAACCDSEKELYKVEEFLKFHPYLRRQMLLISFEKLTKHRKDITAAHIDAVLSLFEEKKNRKITLPYKLCASRSYDEVLLSKEDEQGEIHCEHVLDLAKLSTEEINVDLPDGDCLSFSVTEYKKSMNIPQNQYTKWFDYDKIKKPLEIRFRREGDFLVINDKGQKKSLQDYMVNEKIPKEQRDFMPILCEDNHVLWVPSYRISSFYKIDVNTKRILQVQLRGGR